jgi:phosphonate transport system substrate-binding protein
VTPRRNKGNRIVASGNFTIFPQTLKTMFRKSVQNAIILMTFLLLLPFINSCSEQASEKPAASDSPSPKKFYLGLIPEQDLFSQKERYAPLAGYISEKAGVNVEIRMLSRYGNIIENFISGQLDGAFLGSFTGALAIKTLGVEPIARPLWLDDTSTYYGIIFARKDSGIQNAADMKGKRFAFVDKATTAGWLLPLNFFHELGIEDYPAWFGETYFTGTHEDAIYDVLNGKADIGAAKNTIFYRLAAKDSRLLDELQILAQSPEVPANSLAVREDLDPALKTKLRNLLLEMDHTEEGKTILRNFGAKKFIETTEKDYEPVFVYADKVKLDLKKYNYWND